MPGYQIRHRLCDLGRAMSMGDAVAYRRRDRFERISLSLGDLLPPVIRIFPVDEAARFYFPRRRHIKTIGLRFAAWRDLLFSQTLQARRSPVTYVRFSHLQQ